jgi:CRISPR/Cas system type I-B associated protein Csh2 (Cas7 group RAMP superfamily)
MGRDQPAFSAEARGFISDVEAIRQIRCELERTSKVGTAESTEIVYDQATARPH